MDPNKRKNENALILPFRIFETNSEGSRRQCIRIDTKANREHDRPAVAARREGKRERGARTSGGGQMRLLAAV